MTDGLIVVERIERCAFITLNRPQKANAMNAAGLADLMQALDEISADDSVHALMISGAGERVFCGGADLSEPDTMANEALWEQVTEKIALLPQLTIALINGACIGGGLVLALSCDMRIGVPHTSFAYPVLRNRLLPERNAARRLTTLIGPGRCKMILMGAQRIDASEAVKWGLLDRQVAADELREVGIKLSQAACEVEREHVSKMKQRLAAS